MSGTASTRGGARPLSPFFIKGSEIIFTIGDDGTGESTVEYTGKVNGNKASGTAKGAEGSWSWTATRTKPGERPEIKPAAAGS